MESSYATSNEMRSSVAVGTAERGLSHPSLLPRLGIVPLPRGGVDHMLSLSKRNCCLFFFVPVSGVSVVCSVFPPVSCGVCATPLWLLVSPAASNLEPPLRWM
jgi:hypothetical protein